jgi:arsenate reductase
VFESLRAHQILKDLSQGKSFFSAQFTMTSVKLHGIANCNTVKLARADLAQRGVVYEFHDFKKLGVPAERLAAWVASLGWERLLNRQGTTWRKLDLARQQAVVDAASAMALMCEQPSCIRRPVVEWADGAITVGFDAAQWALRTAAI